MQMFTTSSLELGILKAGMGKRDSSVQRNFREALIKDSNAEHPNPLEDLLWCLITNRYVDADSMTAAHIFACRHGQETMTAIFGSEHPPELFSPANAILMYKKAEEFFDKGHFVIVFCFGKPFRDRS